LSNKKQRYISPAFFDYLRYFDILGFNLLSFPLLRSLPDLRSGIYEVYENCRLSIPKRRLPLSDSVLVMAKIACYLKNFFRPNTAMASKPESKRSMVAGSGTGSLVTNTLSHLQLMQYRLTSLISFVPLYVTFCLSYLY